MKHKFALIGCGRISHKHIEAYVNDKDRIELVAVCDVVKERAEEKAAEYKEAMPGTEVKVYTDYRKLLDEMKPSAVTIAAESGYHASIAIDCLNAGCHVITEKPMALSSSDAQEMIDTAKKAGKKLGVCYQNRFNAPIQKTFEAIRDGRMGRLMHGMIQIRWNRNEGYYLQAPWRGTWKQDGGTLMNQCTHGIDLLQWLMCASVKKVHGVTRRFLRPIEAEDFGGALLEFDDGQIGMIEGTADVYPKNLNETLSLFGDKGSVVIGGLAVNRIETWKLSDAEKVGDTEDVVLDPNQADPPSVYGFGHSALFAEFVDAIEEDREPFINGTEGKKSLDIVLAIYQSMKTGQPVDMPVDFDTMQMKGIFK